MAYKAVSTNESHIAHANRPRMAYQYVPTHNGIGNPHHGFGGMFTHNPAGSADQGHTGGGDGYHYAKNTTDWSAKPVSDDVNNYYTNSNNYNTSGGNPNSSSSESNSGPVNYTRKDPYTMTNEQIKEENTRAQLISKYNQYYPSKSEEYAKAANNTKQLISDGGAFVKKVMPDRIYVPLDLSNMTDEQLRAANNRAQLESQYNQYFNPPKQNKSKEWVDVAVTGANLLISASAIAAPIIWDVIKAKKGQGK